MSNQLTYKAVLTLNPPEADGKLVMHLTLHPADTIATGGIVKPLGDCTILELRQYAEDEEAALGEAYAAMSIESLVANEKLAIDGDGKDFLEHVVILPRAVEAEIVETEAGAEEIEAIAENIAIEELPPRTASVIEDDIQLVEDAPDEVEDVVSADEIQFVEASAVAEDAPISADSIHIAEPEPIFDERETDDPVRATRDPQPDVKTAGILPDNSYPDFSAVAIWLDEQPLRMMQGHARTSLNREVAGVMLGPLPEKQPDGRYVVHVTDMIIAKHTKMAGASVTYTPESWRYINDQLEKMYPDGDTVIVGWYHTHPGFGIFLSNMDLFIHTNFFTQKWHIAYVLDPVGFRSGFFAWDKDQAKVVPYHFPWPEWTSHTSW